MGCFMLLYEDVLISSVMGCMEQFLLKRRCECAKV